MADNLTNRATRRDGAGDVGMSGLNGEWSPDYWGGPSPDGKSTNEEHGQDALLAQ